jgi:predicted Zn-dependent protease
MKIVARFGVYRDPELSAYVTRVGERIAKESNRPDLNYTFTILNDEEINAFAVPGGFVYVTRGILMHLNSESELAAVLGHEIAHVTEKHAFRSKTRGQILNAASTIGAFLIGLPGVKEIGDMASEALLMGYSRDFELEADAVGAEYMAKAGYSPEAMLRTIEILKNKDRVEIMRARDEQREPRVYHGFLSTCRRVPRVEPVPRETEWPCHWAGEKDRHCAEGCLLPSEARHQDDVPRRLAH